MKYLFVNTEIHILVLLRMIVKIFVDIGELVVVRVFNYVNITHCHTVAAFHHKKKIAETLVCLDLCVEIFFISNSNAIQPKPKYKINE